MTLLSRVASNVYWAARYLERAEDTARIVREHTNLLVDLPRAARPTWAPLLAVVGREPTDEVTESEVVRLLVADPGHPSSIRGSVTVAREDLRTTREVLPREAWEAANELFLFVAGEADGAVARRARTRFLDGVVARTERITGVLVSTLRRDETFAVARMGAHLERADMTTRVLDVRAAAILEADPSLAPWEGLRWASVLRSLSALQMYHRTLRRQVDGPSTVRFLLDDALFPRSVRASLGEVRRWACALPRHTAVVDAVDAATGELAGAADAVTAAAVRECCDRLQVAIAAVHDAIDTTWFRPSAGPSPAASQRQH